MPKINKVDHTAIVVEDIEDALGFWRDVLGLELNFQEDDHREKATVAFLPIGDSNIELVQPTSEDSGIATFLAKRGPGMHHICLEVDDIAAMLRYLKEKNIQLIHDHAITSSNGKKYAFIHPKAASGVLLELYQLPKKL
ncbi:MAG: methylmalonyl-CoA epimerase [Anaerolineae bacterium]|nr:methylmalonyl-CoA epimerase [Anaerolineae bacterium]